MSLKIWQDGECRHCVTDRKFGNSHEARHLQTENIVIIIIIIIIIMWDIVVSYLHIFDMEFIVTGVPYRCYT